LVPYPLSPQLGTSEYQRTLTYCIYASQLLFQGPQGQDPVVQRRRRRTDFIFQATFLEHALTFGNLRSDRWGLEAHWYQADWWSVSLLEARYEGIQSATAYSSEEEEVGALIVYACQLVGGEGWRLSSEKVEWNSSTGGPCEPDNRSLVLTAGTKGCGSGNCSYGYSTSLHVSVDDGTTHAAC
jgi:hypothetical protein